MKKLNKKGYTMVELITAFALLVSFVAVCAGVITSFIRISNNVSAMAEAQSVSNTICKKITSTIASAADNTAAGAAGGGTASVTIASDRKSIVLTDENGYTIDMGVDGDKKLVLSYSDNVHGSTQWYYSNDAYMGNAIESLTFEHIGGTTLIKYSLTVRNLALDYSYTTEKTVECYNLKDAGQIVTASN